MKYAFSTLVCPDWEWGDILSAASDLGFDGIELRGIGSEIHLPNVSLFDEATMQKTRSEISRLHLAVPCLSSGALLFDASLTDAARKEILEYMDLAKRLDVPYVRVLADKEPYPGDVDEAAVISLLQSLLPLAKEQGVTLLVETNGTYADSQRLRDLCDKVDHPSLGVLWDVHHPYRYFGESPQTTYQNLGQYIRHIHVKDSLMKDGKADYQMIGNGDVPISDAMDLLRANGYDGFVVLEWVRRWNTNLESPGIVLPQFLSAIGAKAK